ncbi:MAG: hypothetical protein P1V97_19215, partial [Planctomycetota bacterium]|nr:hypothetical protein [Planctomycetota bacterium]
MLKEFLAANFLIFGIAFSALAQDPSPKTPTKPVKKDSLDPKAQEALARKIKKLLNANPANPNRTMLIEQLS